MKKWAIYRLRYWLKFGVGLGRWMLFFSIVWRVWDVLPDGSVYRLSWNTAWDVARNVHEAPR
jgi:hypothetical protein